MGASSGTHKRFDEEGKRKGTAGNSEGPMEVLPEESYGSQEKFDVPTEEVAEEKNDNRGLKLPPLLQNLSDGGKRLQTAIDKIDSMLPQHLKSKGKKEDEEEGTL